VQKEEEHKCEDCKKLRLECMKGAGRTRPQWLKDGDPRRECAVKSIKNWTKRRVVQTADPNQILTISQHENECGCGVRARSTKEKKAHPSKIPHISQCESGCEDQVTAESSNEEKAQICVCRVDLEK